VRFACALQAHTRQEGARPPGKRVPGTATERSLVRHHSVFNEPGFAPLEVYSDAQDLGGKHLCSALGSGRYLAGLAGSHKFSFLSPPQ